MTDARALMWIALITAIQTVVIEIIRRGASRASREKVIAGVAREMRTAPVVVVSSSEDVPDGATPTPTNRRKFP